jgi:hypothetical protein
MNKDNAKDFLPLVQALADGRLQFKFQGHWLNAEEGCFLVNDTPDQYRIKPEPEPIYAKDAWGGDTQVPVVFDPDGISIGWAKLTKAQVSLIYERLFAEVSR